MAETGETVRVLYVEDDSDFADLSATILEREERQITVQTTSSAEKGLSRLQDCLPDCVISDYNMSEMDGIEFLKKVRKKHSNLPFILFTGQGSEQVASEAISAGVTDYLQKETGTEQYTILANRVTNAVEQYRYRNQLQDERDRVSALFDNTSDAIAYCELEGDEYVIHEVNPAFEEVFGYDTETAIGKDIDDLVVPENHQSQVEEINRRLKAGETPVYDVKRQTVDGIRDFALRPIPLKPDEGGDRTYVIYRDITERKEHESALEQAREELRQTIDLVPDLIFAKNREGEYLLANETTAQAFGVTPKEVEGSKESEIIPNIEDSEEFREDDLEVIDSGESKFIPEEELTTADGDTRMLQTEKIPYEVPGSGEDAVLGYGRDVTDLKEYEQKLETQRDNLEILNQVVRHDIRNDLQIISIYAEALEPYVEEEGKEYVSKILEAIRHPIELTETARELTDVMLHSNVEHSSVVLKSVLEREIDTIRSTHDQASVTVEETIPEVEILANDMLGSVFRNLLHNAIQHNDGESPEITVSTTLSDDTVSVSISDNGPGITDEHKEEIFAKGESGLDSGGTGLGLYLVQALVEQYDGAVRVEDNDPEGTVFIVELPVAE